MSELKLISELREAALRGNHVISFEVVHGDVIKRTAPHSTVCLNSGGAWIVGENVRSGMRAKAQAEYLLALHAAFPQIVELVDSLESRTPDKEALKAAWDAALDGFTNLYPDDSSDESFENWYAETYKETRDE